MRWLRSAAALITLGGIMLWATPAQASVPTSFCNPRAYTYLVKKYKRGAGTYPLRCGTATWGFHHITHRWNVAFDGLIALTISRGERVNDVQQGGGSDIFALFNNRCEEQFRVIYNGGAYRGKGVRPQGIITAYEVTTSTFAPDGVDATDAADPQPILPEEPNPDAVTDDSGDTATIDPATYRNDCPVIQHI